MVCALVVLPSMSTSLGFSLWIDFVALFSRFSAFAHSGPFNYPHYPSNLRPSEEVPSYLQTYPIPYCEPYRVDRVSYLLYGRDRQLISAPTRMSYHRVHIHHLGLRTGFGNLQVLYRIFSSAYLCEIYGIAQFVATLAAHTVRHTLDDKTAPVLILGEIQYHNGHMVFLTEETVVAS